MQPRRTKGPKSDAGGGMKRTPLERRTPLKRSGWEPGGYQPGKGKLDAPKPKKRSGFTPASKEQRGRVSERVCIHCVLGWPCDPAHLCARAQGGCDDALCVVPLCRECHGKFDRGEIDLLPDLVRWRVEELQHALGHYNGDLIALLQRLTGCRWAPEKEAA